MKVTGQTTILAIETSCDETSAAVVRGTELLSNVVYSQLDLHAHYGGVVPSVARTAHQEKLPGIVDSALREANVEIADVDLIAVTQGPGLAIALEVGINYAKELGQKYEKPVVGINHMEGHLFSWLAGQNLGEIQFPVLGLLVSGGHTEFVLVETIGSYKKVGRTLDDACGEAFDKAAVMLGLGYPGGPKISQAAVAGRERLKMRIEKDQQSTYVRAGDYELPIPMLNSGDLNMSYSGLKTAVKHMINSLEGRDDKLNIRETGERSDLNSKQIEDIAAVFEEAATEQIVRKLGMALKKYPEVKEVWMGGGVIANKVLRAKIEQLTGRTAIAVRMPGSSRLTADNAGMIGLAAALRYQNQEVEDQSEQLDRKPGLSL